MFRLRRIPILVVAIAAALHWGSEGASAQTPVVPPDPCPILPFATTGASGTIAPGETDCWRFAGATGDVVRVRVVKTAGTNFTPYVELLRPGGGTRCAPTTAREFNCTLDASGMHTILVRDFYGSNAGEYKISIQRLNDPVGCDGLRYATSGTPGSIAPPDETDCWRFAGATGDVVRVRVVKTAGTNFTPYVELLRPGGGTRCAPTTAREFNCTLDASGMHTILVRDFSGSNAGDYKISIELVSSAAGLALEGEHLSGDGPVMPRSAASGLKTVWLHAGESRRGAFEVAAAGRYHVAVWYSNDNHNDRPLERVTVTIDGARVGVECPAQDTGDGGHGWNIFARCDIGNVDLSAGSHELAVAVSGGDGYGVEIDLITLTPVPHGS